RPPEGPARVVPCRSAEGRLEQRGLLLLVDAARTGGRRGGRRAGDEAQLAPTEGLARQVVGQEGPRPLVAGLVLDPDDLRAGVAVELGPHRVLVERVELLEPDDRRGRRAGLLPVRGEVVVDPAGA